MRREEIEALAAEHDTLAKRMSTWRSGDAAQDRAYNAGRREAHEDAAKMLREALAKSEAGPTPAPVPPAMACRVAEGGRECGKRKHGAGSLDCGEHAPPGGHRDAEDDDAHGPGGHP